jgi:hypothetical protein
VAATAFGVQTYPVGQTMAACAVVGAGDNTEITARMTVNVTEASKFKVVMVCFINMIND